MDPLAQIHMYSSWYQKCLSKKDFVMLIRQIISSLYMIHMDVFDNRALCKTNHWLFTFEVSWDYVTFLRSFFNDVKIIDSQWNHEYVIMGTMVSQITSLTIVYLIVYSDAGQTKHQSSASLAFVRGIHRWPVNSPHKGPVTRKVFPFDDVTIRMSAGCKVIPRCSVDKVYVSYIYMYIYIYISESILFGESHFSDI